MHAARPAARTCTAPVVACGGMQLAPCLLELLARLSPPSRAPLSSLSRASLLPLARLSPPSRAPCLRPSPRPSVVIIIRHFRKVALQHYTKRALDVRSRTETRRVEIGGRASERGGREKGRGGAQGYAAPQRPTRGDGKPSAGRRGAGLRACSCWCRRALTDRAAEQPQRDRGHVAAGGGLHGQRPGEARETRMRVAVQARGAGGGAAPRLCRARHEGRRSVAAPNGRALMDRDVQETRVGGREGRSGTSHVCRARQCHGPGSLHGPVTAAATKGRLSSPSPAPAPSSSSSPSPAPAPSSSSSSPSPAPAPSSSSSRRRRSAAPPRARRAEAGRRADAAHCGGGSYGPTCRAPSARSLESGAGLDGPDKAGGGLTGAA
jgi:hypothetical protein